MKFDSLDTRIVELFDLGQMPELERMSRIIDIETAVFQNFILSIRDRLSIDERDQLQVLLDGEQDMQLLEQFIATVVPNYEEVYSDELLKLKAKYEILKGDLLSSRGTEGSHE